MEEAVDTLDLRRVAARIAAEAAAYLRDMACSGSELSKNMGGETVLVDIMAEDYIIGALREELGEVRIVTEERGVIGKGPLTAIVDPLDGSKNYLNCIPWASVSIAIVPTGKPMSSAVAGAVAPIFHGRPVSFARGHGCFLGEERAAALSPPERFIFVYIDHPEAAQRIAGVVRSLGGGYKIRSLGSAALELAYTGIGRGTAFIDFRSKLRNVDVAASIGVIRECGGAVINDRGENVDGGTERVERVGNIIAVPSPAILTAMRPSLGLGVNGEA